MAEEARSPPRHGATRLQSIRRWEVITSPEAVLGGPSVAGSRLFREGAEGTAKIQHEPALRNLAISKRSYETDVTAAWVNALLDGRTEGREHLPQGLPICVTSRHRGRARHGCLHERKRQPPRRTCRQFRCSKNSC